MIKILSPHIKSLMNEEKYYFYLRQDNWNDHSFQTQYHLHISAPYSNSGDSELIGTVKILKKGQRKSDGLTISYPGSISSLDESFCSLGQSLDYYERIASLPENLKNYIIKALNDVVLNPEIKANFINEEGWNISLTRHISADDDIFTLPKQMFDRNYSSLVRAELKFSFKNQSMENSIEFDFDSKKYGYNEKLPSRIIVLVGRNGSGKSTMLSKISRVAFASGIDRENEILKQVGEFHPKGIGFSKILNISYSAFDSFKVPGIYKHDKQQIIKDIEFGKGRYFFCGIRDICKELKQSLDTMEADSRGRLTAEEILKDRESFTHLKTIETLKSDIVNLVDEIYSLNRMLILNKVFEILKREPSFKHLLNELDEIKFKESIPNIFNESSTGHKFCLHAILNIIAHTEHKALVLFDEPETHLHPPLLAVLMSSIRYILQELDAFAIVATHSPIVVQETLRRHVKIVRRVGKRISIKDPEIQTFGENISSITTQVFGLSSEITEFHHELDKVINNNYLSVSSTKQDKYDQIEDAFDGELSMQASAYVMSKLAKQES